MKQTTTRPTEQKDYTTFGSHFKNPQWGFKLPTLPRTLYHWEK